MELCLNNSYILLRLLHYNETIFAGRNRHRGSTSDQQKFSEHPRRVLRRRRDHVHLPVDRRTSGNSNRIKVSTYDPVLLH